MSDRDASTTSTSIEISTTLQVEEEKVSALFALVWTCLFFFCAEKEIFGESENENVNVIATSIAFFSRVCVRVGETETVWTSLFCWDDR